MKRCRRWRSRGGRQWESNLELTIRTSPFLEKEREMSVGVFGIYDSEGLVSLSSRLSTKACHGERQREEGRERESIKCKRGIDIIVGKRGQRNVQVVTMQ